MERRYSTTLRSDDGMEDEHKTRDIEIATEPRPIEMWTGPIETKTDSTPETPGQSVALAFGEDEGVGMGGVKRISTVRIAALTIIMILTYFLGAVSSQAVTLNVPAMARDLGLTQLEAQWVVSAYTLAYGCGLLFSGRIADVYGRKLCFLIGSAVFVVFNVVSGAVHTYIPLCVIRAISGLGMALAGPSGFGVVGANVVTEPARTIVFAAFGLGGPIGAATGTLLGGAVAAINADRNWSYLFYILGGMGMIPLVIAWFAMPWDRRAFTGSKVPKIDWLGGLLVTAGISLFMFSLTQSGVLEDGWSVPYVPVVFVLSLVLLVVFMLWERHLENKTTFPPIAKFSLFTRHRYRFTALMGCAFFCCITTPGFVYTATIWYQELKGETALQNAILLLPCNIMGLGAAGGAMYVVPRYKAPHLIAFGGFMAGITSVLYATCPPNVSYWAWEFVAQLCLPWGIDFIVCVGNVLVTNLVAQDEQSVGGALFQTSYTVGSALGNNLSSLVIEKVGINRGDLLHGLRAASGLNTAAAWIIPFIALIGLRGLGVARDAAKVLDD